MTILFSDIRGFTEYADVYGDESAYRMLRLHNTLVQEQLALYRGHVVQTQAIPSWSPSTRRGRRSPARSRGFFMDGQSGSIHLESVRYYAVS